MADAIPAQNFRTAKDFATDWGISVRRISRLCQMGRIPGAFKPSARLWLIPTNATKPADARFSCTTTKTEAKD